ncbi:bifunctional phosphatase PAP2/diacylglycerol kinase family protein [Streptomyces sp. NPDC059785]|uniref:bifunctional phosphatase PAP2/diacylglycerol kinase family protein n=1 Tax=unclassified Streptomyces TaxID=2593676 RepID=UPI003653657C
MGVQEVRGAAGVPGVWDRRLFTRVAAARLPGAGPVLTRLSRSADHGRLWLGTAAVLAAAGGRTARRAALRGAGSLALASLTVNTVAKWGARRPRPLADPVPPVRRLRHPPHTTSFPSGHAASAAAFATGVALESTRYGVLAAPLAAAVAFSRVYVGVHYPGDVLAGAAVGAAAAVLTCHWWPPRAVAPERERPASGAPALPAGRGLVVVVNTRAGSGASRVPLPHTERLRALLPDAELIECGPDSDLTALLGEAAARAAAAGGALGVCGGDGSVNAAARLASARGLPLAVFPGGTLNHFAQDVGVPGFEDTAGAVTRGEAVAVDVAVATPATGEEVRFLNTFSIGVFPELVHMREQLQHRMGKWPAGAVALVRALRTAVPLELLVDGRPRRLWLLFAGNGRCLPDGFAPRHRQRLDDGLIDLRMIDGAHRLARTRVVLSALAGVLGRSRVYSAETVPGVRLAGLRGTDRLAYDGEVAAAPAGLRLDKHRRGLVVYRPAASH